MCPYHLNHFTGGDYEQNGGIVEFDTVQDAQTKLEEWEEKEWSIEDENHNCILTYDPELD